MANHSLMRTADVIVIGGGVIGCSIAYHLLRKDNALRLILLEREMMLGMGASAKATGGIRHQFSSEGNIRLTQLSLPLYLRFEEETGYSVHFRPCGYLFVTANERVLTMLRRAVAVQQSMGVTSRVISASEIAELIPAMRTEDLLGGSFCEQDGSAEPAAAVQGFATKARALGAEILTGQEVVALLKDQQRITGVRTRDQIFQAPVVVIATGPQSAQVAGKVGLNVPARPYRRQVSVVGSVRELNTDMPLTFDADTGFYMHRIGHSEILLGGTDRDTRPGLGLEVDWEGVERVLIAGASRVPVLNNVQVKRTYVGIRALTPDNHPIVGRVKGIEGLVLACGDCGHGFMHAPAIGLLVTEEILDGQATTMDLASFRIDRFAHQVHPETHDF